MKILLVCMQFDYGDPKRGFSFEYVHFYKTLQAMGHEVVLFDFMTEFKRLGKVLMQQELIEQVRSSNYDLAFFSLYTDQFDGATVQEIKKYTKTLCFFHDDTWRLDFCRYWAQQFDYFTTPDCYGEYKYRKLGLTNSIYFPFGCNFNLYKPLDLEQTIDVSFVGAWHPYRNWLVNQMRKAGIKVETAGFGWPRGILNYDEMVHLFNSSKINLNLSNSTSWDLRYLLSSPKVLINNLRSPKNVEQIKARHFEINSCRVFQLSYYVEGLERHYEIGKEIGIYTDVHDLLNKVRFYLGDDALRQEIAANGYKRSQDSHSYESRFQTTFETMGLI